MIADEKYDFKPATKRNIFILGLVGIVIFIAGVLLARSGGGHEGKKEEHASAVVSKELTASVTPVQEEHGEQVKAAEHEETPVWLKRIKASLWQNNLFFIGIGIIGLFFVAIQYAAQAGWSAPIKRIPLAMGSWIPVAGVLM